MDPLALEALRFGIAILAGGIVAVISSVLAFSYARRLQHDERDRGDRALRRALIAEIRENMQRLGGPTVTGVPAAHLVRSAWDSTRTLELSADVVRLVGEAYGIADGVNAEVALLSARAGSKGFVASREAENALRIWAQTVIAKDATKAYEAFAAALHALED